MPYSSYPLHCIRADIIPTEKHWAVILFTPSTDYHGDPIVRLYYEAYNNQEAWAEAIHELVTNGQTSGKEFVAMEVNPAKIEVQTNVRINA